jgi:hypothetical protein
MARADLPPDAQSLGIPRVADMGGLWRLAGGGRLGTHQSVVRIRDGPGRVADQPARADGRVRRDQTHPRVRARPDLQTLRRAQCPSLARCCSCSCRRPMSTRRHRGRSRTSGSGSPSAPAACSSSWRSPAAAALVWRNTFDGQPHQQLAFNAMLTSGVSTMLFNANPLMKFDGYYMLSDLLEVPNLMQRSTQALQVPVSKKPRVSPEQRRAADDRRGEAAILLSMACSRWCIASSSSSRSRCTSWGRCSRSGSSSRCWTAAMWFILPTGKFVHWLASSAPVGGASRARDSHELGLNRDVSWFGRARANGRPAHGVGRGVER